MTPLRAFRKTMTILGAALALAVGVSCLPENEYQRWQLLDGTIHANARWIYERCHFDPTPIDIAFIGPSRVQMGVDAPRLSEELAAKGMPAQVVNFSLPETGRDINFLVAEQLFATKKPKLVVLGVLEKPARFGHSAFKYIAAPLAVLAPGYFSDVNYFSNLVYLPFRQMFLFFADLMPDAAGLTKTFDKAHYRGPVVATTGNVQLPDGRIKNGETPASAAELTRGIRKLEANTHPPILPERYADIEFGDERHYVEQIVDLAQRNGAKVAFLFIPYQTGPSIVQQRQFYEQFGPIWNAGFLSPHAEWYADYGHLTRTGANELTDWLVARVERQIASEGASQ